MNIFYTGAFAALALLVFAHGAVADGPGPKSNPNEALPSSGRQEVDFEGRDCWSSSGNDTYEAFGQLQGKPYVWVSIRPIIMTNVDPANLTEAGTFRLNPSLGVVKSPTIKRYHSYKGYNRHGMAVYLMPEEMTFSLIFYINDERTQAVTGKIEICKSATFE